MGNKKKSSLPSPIFILFLMIVFLFIGGLVTNINFETALNETFAMIMDFIKTLIVIVLIALGIFFLVSFITSRKERD